MVETTSRTILLILILASLAAGLAAGVGIGGYALVRTTTFTETRTLTETSLSLTVHPITLTETLTETETFFQTLTETPSLTHTIYETVTEVATTTVTETITTKIETTTATTQTPSGQQLVRVEGGEGTGIRSPSFIPQTDTLRIEVHREGCAMVTWCLIDKEYGDRVAFGACPPGCIQYVYNHHIGVEYYLQIDVMDGRDCEWTITVEDVGD